MPILSGVGWKNQVCRLRCGFGRWLLPAGCRRMRKHSGLLWFFAGQLWNLQVKFIELISLSHMRSPIIFILIPRSAWNEQLDALRLWERRAFQAAVPRGAWERERSRY